MTILERFVMVSLDVFYSTRAVGLEVRHEARVVFAHQRRGDDEVGRGSVTGERDVPDDGHAEEGFDVRVVGLGFEGVPEEDEEVNFVLGDLGADLHVSTERAALEFVDLEPEFLLQEAAGGAGGVDLVGGQGALIELGPLQEIALHVVMGDERNLFDAIHLDFGLHGFFRG